MRPHSIRRGTARLAVSGIDTIDKFYLAIAVVVKNLKVDRRIERLARLYHHILGTDILATYITAVIGHVVGKRYNIEHNKIGAENRIGLCVQSMLGSMLQNHYEKKKIESTIQMLKAEGLYPYRPLWFLLKPQKSVKHFFLNCYLFIQQNERIFFLIERLRR